MGTISNKREILPWEGLDSNWEDCLDFGLGITE